MKIKRIEGVVKQVLLENEEARDDDYILIADVCNRMIPSVGKLPFNICLLGHEELGLPSFESITRARRKLQEMNPSLRSSELVAKARLDKEVEVYNYALNDSNS